MDFLLLVNSRPGKERRDRQHADLRVQAKSSPGTAIDFLGSIFLEKFLEFECVFPEYILIYAGEIFPFSILALKNEYRCRQFHRLFSVRSSSIY